MSPTLRSKVSPEEWQARVDLAAAYRLIDLYGMSDLIANHNSIGACRRARPPS
jgi:hypothetical protein